METVSGRATEGKLEEESQGENRHAAPAASGPQAPWRGLATCGLAAVLGGLSLQLHGLAGADLGGALGLSADEASWANTAGSAAEGAAVLAAAPFIAAFGARRVVICAALATALLAASERLRPDLVIAIRAAEGFACGLLPVVMMSWALRAFPPEKHGAPLMLFAFASSFPAALAATAAGTATAHWGGAGVYVADMIWPPVVALVAMLCLPREAVQLDRLTNNDWFGYVLLASGVVLAIVWLSQGERRFWLATSYMAPLLAIAVAFLALAFARLTSAARPYFDLALLGRPTFAIGLAEALSLRFGLLFASFAVPQALGRLHGFRPEQVGETVLWLAAGQIVGFPLAFAWLARFDGRACLMAGLVAFALASFSAATIDPSWEGAQFQGAMVLAGFGQGLFLTSVLRFATYGIPPAAGATASGLFNLTRVLGTNAATALVGYTLRMRENDHSASLVEAVTDANTVAAERLAALTRALLATTTDRSFARTAANTALSHDLQVQAYTLAFADVFLGIAFVLAVSALLVPALPHLREQVPA